MSLALLGLSVSLTLLGSPVSPALLGLIVGLEVSGVGREVLRGLLGLGVGLSVSAGASDAPSAPVGNEVSSCVGFGVSGRLGLGVRFGTGRLVGGDGGGVNGDPTSTTLSTPVMYSMMPTLAKSLILLSNSVKNSSVVGARKSWALMGQMQSTSWILR